MFRASLVLSALVLASVAVPLQATADHDLALVAFHAVGNYGDPQLLRAQLLDTEDDRCEPIPCPVANRQVDFYIDGVYVGTDLTNQGGFAYLLASSPDWHAGDHAITVRYVRATYPPVAKEATAVLDVLPEVTVLEAREGYVEAQLRTDDGDALVGFPVRFYLTSPEDSHHLCTAYTDATGTARCAGTLGAGLAPVSLDPLSYFVAYDGSQDYDPAAGRAALV